MKVIDLLNKIENGELEENTKFYDKYVKKEYIYKPKSYAGIYPEGKAFANEDWYLTLHSGSFRLSQEVEIIEDTPKEDKKIEKLKHLITDKYMEDKWYGGLSKDEIVKDIQALKNKQNEIIDKVNGKEHE